MNGQMTIQVCFLGVFGLFFFTVQYKFVAPKWKSFFFVMCYHGNRICNLSTPINSLLDQPCPPKANVMLEYDIDEAQALLEKNLSTASRNLETLENDLDFLRDQFTTTEVSILVLRVAHNHWVFLLKLIMSIFQTNMFNISHFSLRNVILFLFICLFLRFSDICASKFRISWIDLLVKHRK